MNQFIDTIEDVTGRTADRERDQVDLAFPLVSWTDEDLAGSVAARFEKVVGVYPDRLVVKYDDQALTYDVLNRTANRIAHAIVAARGTDEEPVAIMIEHGVSIIAAIVGVLKAGKIYVPLDPAHPRARSAAILEDCGAALLVTNDKNLALATDAAPPGCKLLNVDRLDPASSQDNLELPITSNVLLNIMYTSGSTGKPKGVMQRQLNLLHDQWATDEELRINPGDHVALLTSCSFGASAATIMSALLNGAALHPFNLKRDGVLALASWLQREQITHYHSVPTVFRHLLASLQPDNRFPHMKKVQLGGEPAMKRDVEIFRKHFPLTCTFRVGLGSTEAYLASVYLVEDLDEIQGTVVPVGYPVAGKEIMLLDDAGNPVGEGEVGEIAIKSRYLSPGYWNQPEQTANVFLPASDGDERIYLTGDLGRLLPNGCLEHLGRKDFQIKIRGQRVEVSEIETKLLDIAGVREAVVVPKPDQHGEHRLVAYVVPTEDAVPSTNDMRDALAATLPDYMIPSAFVMLRTLPLLPFGKVDRNALPAPDWGRPVGSDYIAPRTPVEETLAQLWSELLGVQQVGVHDSFLDLGGNSLLAAQAIGRANTALGVDLPLNALFDAPTVEQQALLLAQRLAERLERDELAQLVADVEALEDQEM